MSITDIKEAMIASGIDNVPENIQADGIIHRFSTWGDRTDGQSGAYWWNGRCGWFQDWRTMDRPQTVNGKGSHADTAEMQDSLSGNTNKISREKMLNDAQRIWNDASEEISHPYIHKKNLEPVPGIKQHNKKIIIPLHSVENNWNGLQRIDADGRKRFLTGTRKKGSFFGIPGPKDRIVICEGFATGASIHHATGDSVAVAFDAGNLQPVAEAISSKRFYKEIIIAGDNDSWKETEGKKDTGTEKAREAAKSIGCKVAVPIFQNPDGKTTTDFNDLFILEGSESVKKQIDDAEFDRGTVIEKAIKSLADMDPLDREVERNRIAKEYEIRKTFIDSYLAELTRQNADADETKIVEEIEPAEDPVDGAELLDEIMNKLHAVVVLPEAVAVPISLWVMLTYCHIAFRILPLLGIVSPVKRCGKTTLLEFLLGIVFKGLTASNISPAAVYRTVEKYAPTLLIDEADTFLKDNDELRGIVNSGHTRSGAFVIRTQGDDHEPVRFSTWGPKAIAMIGFLPGTLADRSIVIRLRRKTTAEKVRRIGLDFHERSAGIRSRCRRWADDHVEKLKGITIHVPDVGNDRAEDNWTPLFTIAEVAGGDWPDLVTAAMNTLHDHGGEDDSRGGMLLADIKQIFDERKVVFTPDDAGRIFSGDLVKSLNDKKESPWTDWNKGSGITQNGLAKTLKPFGVKSKQIRIGDDNRRGYNLEDFMELFDRYIINGSISGDTSF